MKLEIKTEEDFNQIYAISDESFSGVEQPPHGVLRNRFYNEDVFVLRDQIDFSIYAFAIVTQRDGHPYLWTIAVMPRYRGVGEGADLLEEIILYYAQAGYDEIALTCKIDNPAQKLYFDFGFRVEKVMQRYYGAEGNGLYMRRDL